jgi:hypothetical protein
MVGHTKVAARSGRTSLPVASLPNRNGAKIHNHCIPPPPTTAQVIAPAVRPARGRCPELPHVFPADVHPSRAHYAFVQVMGLRPKAVMADSATSFWIPPPGTLRGPRPAFPQVRDPFSTWWQVKDSNLRSFRDGFPDHRLQARDQRQSLSPNTLRSVFPTDNRRPPTTTGHQHAIRVHGVAPRRGGGSLVTSAIGPAHAARGSLHDEAHIG